MPRLLGWPVLLAWGVLGGLAPALPAVAQSPPGADARVMTLGWTLYPGMWAEVDLRLGADAEAVAEVRADGGEVTWDVHTHPPDAAESSFVTLDSGVTRRASIRCAPGAAGRYSYLFRNAAAGGPVRVRIELRLVGEARLEAIRP